LRLPEESRVPRDTIEQVISRRGSTRQFARDPLTKAQLSLILDRATRGIPADFLDPFGSHLNDLYLIVNNVHGLEAGAYFYHREKKYFELLKAGEFRDRAGYLGLEQQIPADAAVDVFFLADLKKILERYGNRGYRAMQLEAGIVGGKLYLGAYAQKLGASGLTFYDDDVVSFFSPHARGKSAIFLVALGRSVVQK
jgi:SagB-type dehydrogenase family enzyme